MKKIILAVTIIVVLLFTIGCTKQPNNEIPSGDVNFDISEIDESLADISGELDELNDLIESTEFEVEENEIDENLI